MVVVTGHSWGVCIDFQFCVVSMMDSAVENEGNDDQQLFHDLEQRYVSLRTEYDSVCSERNDLEGRFSTV